MKPQSFALLMIFGIILSKETFAEENCTALRKNKTVSFELCCDLPDAFSVKEAKETYDVVLKETADHKDEHLVRCLMRQKLFDNYHLADDKNNLDKVAIRKFYHERITDKNFAEMSEKAVEICFNHTETNLKFFQSKLNFTADKCDTIFYSFVRCHLKELFLKCPEENMVTDNKMIEPCENTKKFLVLCA